MGMAEMIAMMAADQSDDSEEMTILPEAAMRLREVAGRYAESLIGPRFKVGDIVTPTAGSAYKNFGNPHIVVETRAATPDFSRNVESSSSFLGHRLDMRILAFGNDHIFAHWVESYEFERWTDQTGGTGL